MKALATMFLLLALLGLFGTYQQESSDRCGKGSACIVTGIQGTCLVREQGKAKPQILSKKNAIGKRLRAGHAVQCASPGYLKITFCASRIEIEVRRSSPKWYTVPNVPSSEPEEDIFKILGRERPKNRVAEYFRIPSREELIIEPPTRAFAKPLGEKVAAATTSIIPVAWANTFVFRWDPISDQSNLTVLLRMEDGKILWSKSGIDGRMQRLSSEEARAVLRRFGEKTRGAYFRFSLLSKDIELQTAVFSLLTPEEEKSLVQELKEFDEEEFFLRQIDRADAFYRRRLYADEADEYETALVASPESEDLLFATFIANCRARNVSRATELVRQLPQEPPYSNIKCLP